MHYHILLTELCNSQCRYCYKKSMCEEEFDSKLKKKFEFDFSSPATSEVDVKKLRRFLGKDPDPVLVFYGGEPLLEIEKIKKIMDGLKDKKCKFRMQTNGLLLNELPSAYINKISKILVSLDGSRERTDFNRGKGTYERVVKNLQLIQKNGYQGEIIARMTISGFPDLYNQVLSLINEGFTSIHWQLDAGFYQSDFKKDKFSEFVEEYNREVIKLAYFWTEDMKMNRRVLRLYPFMAIIESLLKNEKTLLRCGAGHSGYAITTSGKIIACPIMNCIKDFEAGDLDSEPRELKKFQIKGRCLKCTDKDLCGGRCLYWNYSNLWPEEGDDLICKTIKNLLNQMKFILPEIKSMIERKVIREEQFNYEKYFGPEIIP